MAGRPSTATFGKQIRTLFSIGVIGAMTDGALLDHFARGGEAAEPAFATLVERHGPMVRAFAATCWPTRILPRTHFR